MTTIANGYISFNSKDRKNKTVSSNRIRYDPFNLQMRDISGWALSEATFKPSDYNITEYNNGFAISDGIQSFPIYIDVGNYTLQELALVLEDALNTPPVLPTNFTVTPETNQTISIENIGTSFEFVEFDQVSKDIASMMGWEKNTGLLNELFGWPQLNYTDYVDIVSISLNQKNPKGDFSTNKRTTNIIGRICLNDFDNDSVKVGKLICEKKKNLKMMKTDKYLPPDNIEIEIRDEYGNLYYDPLNTMEYSLLMMTV
jgi:hypothetical protein